MPEFDSATIHAYIKKYLHLAWEVVENNRLRLQFDLMDFDEAIAFVNHLAKVANKLNHHPNIHIYYNVVIVEIYTHSVGMLTDKDLRLATEIEKIV